MEGRKKKITLEMYVDENESPKSTLKKMIAHRIKVLARMKSEVMAKWGRELGVQRQFIYQVVEGKRKNPRVRRFIEKRLGQKFWNVIPK